MPPTAKAVALFDGLCNDASTESVFDAAVRVRNHVRECGTRLGRTGVEATELHLGQAILGHPALAPPVIDMSGSAGIDMSGNPAVCYRPSNLPDPAAGWVLTRYQTTRPDNQERWVTKSAHWDFEEMGTGRRVLVENADHATQCVELYTHYAGESGLTILDKDEFKVIFPMTTPLEDPTITEPIAVLVEARATWLVHLQQPLVGPPRQIVSRLTEDGVEIHTTDHDDEGFDHARYDRDFGDTAEERECESLPGLEKFADHVRDQQTRRVLPMTKFNALRRALLLKHFVVPWMAALREAVEIKRMNPEGKYAPEHTVRKLVAAAMEAVKGGLALGLEAVPAKRQRL